MRELDAAGVIRVLNDYRVTFIVIGGIAAELHDLNIRPTIDIDVTPARDAGNLARLAGAFDALEAALNTADENGTWFPRVPVQNWAQYNTLHLITRYGALDIVFSPSGAEAGYSDLAPGAEQLMIGDQPVMVIGVQKWVQLKEAAGRLGDQEDLKRYEMNARDKREQQPPPAPAGLQ